MEEYSMKKWKYMMGWMYMAVCIFDFIVAPVLWAVVQFWEYTEANDAFRQWVPITLQGAGLFHMAMGAVLGISAFKGNDVAIAQINSPPTPTPSASPNPVVQAPVKPPPPNRPPPPIPPGV
jgi:hypothetical protein